MSKEVSRKNKGALLVMASLAFLLLFLGGTALWAQTTAGTINGTITDQSQAAVPEADVTVTNESTLATVHVQSSAGGVFAAVALPVGHYKVTVAKTGFQTYTEAGIIVEPSGVRTINITLQLGSVASSVTVSAALGQIETTTSETANQVGSIQTAILPLNGRNYQSLAALMPGVLNMNAGVALGTGGHGTSNAMSINGMGSNASFYTVDGIWNMNTGNMTQSTIEPNPDTIQEVRVLQNNYDPKYSLMGASVVQIETLSGTQDYHGNLFEYVRNTDLDARNFFAPTVPVEHQNIFGGTLGGPVFIPGKYNQSKDKSFIFFNAQFVRKVIGVVNTGSSPTAAMRQGLFSTSIKDPTTGAPFPTNGSGQYVIPSGEINQSGLALLNTLVPLPNNPAGGFNDYLNLNPQVLNQNHYQVRGDQYFGAKEHLSGAFFQIHELELDPNDTGPYATTTHYLPGTYRMVYFQLTSTLRPSMVNQAEIGWNMDSHDYTFAGIWQISQLPGFTESLPYNGVLSTRIPNLSFSGGWSSMGTSSTYGSPHLADLDMPVSDDLSLVKGSHQIEAGYNYVHMNKRQSPFAYSQGQFAFDGHATGNPIADFFLGDANSFSQVSTIRRVYVFASIHAGYVQDRWRVTHKLTLNYGLRGQFMPLPHFEPNFVDMFLPSAYSSSGAPIVNANGTITPTANYNPLNGLIRDCVNGTPCSFFTNHQWYWMPMAGFAYDLFGNGKTALRGGYGITYERAFAESVCTYNCGDNYPDVKTLTLALPNFPNPVVPGTQPLTAVATPTIDPNNQAVRVQSWSVNLDRQISNSWTASAGLVGSYASNLGNRININQPLPVSGYNFNPVINTGTFAYQAAPYLGYGAITDYDNGQNAVWYGLVGSLKHAFTHSFFLSVSYTLSHGLSETRGTGIFDGGTGTQDIYHPFQDYGDTNLDARQMGGISYIWNLPGFQKSTKLARTTLSGWSFNGITSFRTGLALDPGLSVKNQGLATRPNLIAPITYNKTHTSWFSTSSFLAPAAGFFGNSGTGVLRGPGMIDFDMALFKDFALTEHHKVEFRAEAFNVFNHTNFNAVSTACCSGAFGTVTSALDPRIMEFALRYQF